MDRFVKNVLAEWMLEEKLATFFNTNQIDEESFNTLTESDIKELIPPLGPRKQFIVKYTEYIRCKALRSDIVSSSDNKTSIAASNSIVKLESCTSSSPNLGNNSKDYGLREVHYPQKTSSVLNESVSSYQSTVQKLLEETEEGKLIAASYKGGKFMRNKLSELIIRHELNNSAHKRIATERFVTLADEISLLFLHERSEIYYVPYVKNYKDKRPKAASGKLYSTYIYMRKLYKNVGLLESQSKEEAITPSESIAADVTEEIRWLKNNCQPRVTVEKKWKTTTSERLKNINTIDSYFQTFPGLRQPLGYRLLLIDFENLYSAKVNCLYNEWPICADKIIKLAATKRDTYITNILQQYETSSDKSHEVKELCAFNILPFLLFGVNIKSKKPSLHWKPSKVEAQKGFLLTLSDPSEIARCLDERQKKLSKLKLTAQPLPIVTVSTQEYYVSVNNNLFVVETLIKAIDTCFKCYHVLNAEYPKESEPVWLFLQKYIYNISRKHDKHYMSVFQLISDIDNMVD